MRQMSFLVVLALAVLCEQGCGNAEARVRGALNVSAPPIDAAYGFAMEACILREETIAQAAEKGALTVEAARAQLVPVRARCDRARQGFELLRNAHDAARAAVDDGDVAAAEQWIRALQRQWDAFLSERRGEVTDGGK